AVNGAYAAQQQADADDKLMEEKFNQYSLPYGVLGAISHIITYWVLFCHYYGRCPWWPPRRLQRKDVNMCSVLVSSIVSITIIAVTLSRVHETQALAVLAVMQVVLSI